MAFLGNICIDYHQYKYLALGIEPETTQLKSHKHLHALLQPFTAYTWDVDTTIDTADAVSLEIPR